MIGLEDRRTLAQDIRQAHQAGARLDRACALAGIDVRPPPAHALSAEDRARLLRVANEPRFADMPPARIVPALAEEGIYLASESNLRRVLRDHGQNQHPGGERTRHARAGRRPRTWRRHRASCDAGTGLTCPPRCKADGSTCTWS